MTRLARLKRLKARRRTEAQEAITALLAAENWSEVRPNFRRATVAYKRACFILETYQIRKGQRSA